MQGFLVGTFVVVVVMRFLGFGRDFFELVLTKAFLVGFFGCICGVLLLLVPARLKTLVTVTANFFGNLLAGVFFVVIWFPLREFVCTLKTEVALLFSFC